MDIILLPPWTTPMSELLHYDKEDLETLKTTQERESSKLKKIKNDQIKKMLEQATIQLELMAQISWRLHLARESTITFDEALHLDDT